MKITFDKDDDDSHDDDNDADDAIMITMYVCIGSFIKRIFETR